MRASGTSSSADSHSARLFPPVTLSWENLRYSIPLPSPPLHLCLSRLCCSRASGQLKINSTGDEEALLAEVRDLGEDWPAEKYILRGVNGIVHPGELCAIMGASGAGKTTLLDVLASRGVHGRLSGDVRLNGLPVKKQSYFRRISGYVMQDNIMLETLTVRETLSFAARLKLPRTMPREQKERRVDEVLRELGIEHIAHSLVGSPGKRGISGGELKRVAIAQELVSSPSLLFLDEPTSGLDSNGATSLVLMLKRLAQRSQRTIVSTIHQPSSHMFHAFDKLLLLAQGRVIYFGKASQVIEYFANMKIAPEPNTNPADFILDIAFHARKKDRLAGAGQGGEHLQVSLPAIRQDELSDFADQQMDEDGRVEQFDVPTTNELADRYQHSTNYEELTKELEGETTESRKGIYVKQGLGNVAKYGVSLFMQLWLLFIRELLYMVRHPQLCKARAAQQVLMGLIIGSIWFQVPQDSFYIANIQGMLFMTAAFLSFASFSSVPTFVEQRIIFNRERAAGMYHPLSYFLSKVIVNFTLAGLLVVLECAILYFMVGLRDDEWYYFFTFTLILLATAWCGEAMIYAVSNLAGSAEVAHAIVALGLGFFFTFAGFYINQHTIPDYWIWAKYSSYIKYGFEALVYNEFVDRTIRGEPGAKIIRDTTEDLGLWVCLGVLGGMIGFYLLVAYLALHFLHKEKR